MTPQFVDISAFQGNIDWAAYRNWAAQWDGIARVAMKATEGVGFTDPHFYANRQGALDAGVDMIFYYHFARPDLNNTPIAEAGWHYSVVGSIRPNDMIILDYEIENARATPQWALAWLVEFGPKYGKLPGIYASSYYIETRLQWPGLSAFPLWLANWQYTPDERPAVPSPWTGYSYVQYTDKATNIPGIAGLVDANIFLGGNNIMGGIPQGWTDDGSALTATNGHRVVLGFRDYVLANNWRPDNVPLQEEERADPVEDYYDQPGANSGTRQMFLYSELIWTPQRGAYQPGIGIELLGARRERDQLRKLGVKIPDAVISDIKALGMIYSQVKDAVDQLGKDAGIV